MPESVKNFVNVNCDIVKYDSNAKEVTIYDKNIYKDYPSSTIKSTSERLFEKFCNSSDSIKWFYKNGEHSTDYFSIIYIDAVRKKWAFYPDYILQDEDGNTWIIETKGGETVFGESKNIDVEVKNKYQALRNYANKYNLKWGFVREIDDELYLLNSDEYVEDMKDNRWINVKNIF